MAEIAPWLRPADPNRAQSEGSAAGARLRQIREQAADSLRRHQLGLAAIAQRGAAMRQQAQQEAATRRSREGLAQQEIALAGEKLNEDARQADLMAKFNEQKLAQGGNPNQWQILNTSGGPVRVNKLTGEWEAIPVEGQNSAVQALINRAASAQNPSGATPPQPASSESVGSHWWNPFSWGEDKQSATSAPTLPGRRMPTKNALLSAGVTNPPAATKVDELDPLGLGISK